MNDPRTSCVSDLRFDQLLAGELKAEAVEQIESHAAQCEGCAQRLVTLRRSQDVLGAELPPLVARQPSNVRWVAFAAAVGTLAAAVLLGWWMLSPSLESASTPLGPKVATRLKGGTSVDAFVQRGARSFALGPTDRLSPGDVVALSYSRQAAGFVAVFDVDGGQVEAVHPRGPSTIAAPAGRDVELDVAFELDDSPREEWLVIVFCETQQRVGPLRAALQSQPEGDALPAGCMARRVSLPKEPR